MCGSFLSTTPSPLVEHYHYTHPCRTEFSRAEPLNLPQNALPVKHDSAISTAIAGSTSSREGSGGDPIEDKSEDESDEESCGPCLAYVFSSPRKPISYARSPQQGKEIEVCKPF